MPLFVKDHNVGLNQSYLDPDSSGLRRILPCWRFLRVCPTRDRKK